MVSTARRQLETTLTGETAGISEFAEFGWYDWIKFRDMIVPYPEVKLVLGRYLGLNINIGPAAGFLYAHKPSAGLGNVQFVQRS